MDEAIRSRMAELLMKGGDQSPLAAMPQQQPGYYDRLVSALEGARDFMGGPPTIGGGLNMAMAAIPGGRMPPRGGNAFGRASDLRQQFGVQGSTPQQRAYDASRAETNRVLGVIDDALGPGPHPPVAPAKSTEDVLRAIQEALAIRGMK
jgi:hypothetical protein